MKKEKENRVRLNQNPFIEEETKVEILRRKESFGLSLGKVLDQAVTKSKKHYPLREKGN